MADILADLQGLPIAPAATQIIWFGDTGNKRGFTLDSGGTAHGRSDNASTANQSPFTAADTYIAGSSLQLPSFSMQVGTLFRWRFSVSKTAAGVATPVYQIRIGPNQTTADTSRLTLTGPPQTAAADVALIEMLVTCRSVGGAGVIQGTIFLNHNLAATGFANNASGVVEGTSAGFDNTGPTIGGQFIGVSLNAGAAAVWTMTQARAEALW